MKMPAPRILFLGPCNVGKTHYSVVLIDKWRFGKGLLRLASSVEDLSAYQEARQYISSGKAAPHTPSGTSKETTVILKSDEIERIEIPWPEYAGEQITDVVRSHRVSSRWREQVESSSRWLVMIRPSLIETRPDILTYFGSPELQAQSSALSERQWDEAARWTETMQVLLAAKGVSLNRKISTPRMAVVLSCWDELPDHDASLPPGDILAQRLPLFSAFLKNNWQASDLSCWGLSALGRKLTDEGDSTYMDEGPSEHGFIVDQGGNRSQSLDAPIAWLLRPDS